jgi:hypothetical protein
MNSLIGIWMYTSLIFQGQPMPKPNPDLHMYFTFESAGQNEIFYYRTGENGYCKRRAEYRIEGQQIYQKITWVDPQNADFCSQDSDMRMGGESSVKFELVEDKFYLHLPLGEDVLTYVWERKSPEIN